LGILKLRNKATLAALSGVIRSLPGSPEVSVVPARLVKQALNNTQMEPETIIRSMIFMIMQALPPQMEMILLPPTMVYCYNLITIHLMNLIVYKQGIIRAHKEI
jgi:hypothetical protein